MISVCDRTLTIKFEALSRSDALKTHRNVHWSENFDHLLHKNRQNLKWLFLCLCLLSGSESQWKSANIRKKMFKFRFGWLYVLYSNGIDCDRTFINNPDGLKNGSFSSPNLVNEQKHSRQCIYTFIAGENERVQISFSLFDLRGSTPELVHFLYSYIKQTFKSISLSTNRYSSRVLSLKELFPFAFKLIAVSANTWTYTQNWKSRVRTWSPLHLVVAIAVELCLESGYQCIRH